MEQLNVKNMNGEDMIINVFDIFEDTESKKEYICYSIEPDSETYYISRLVESENSFSLEDVTPEEKAVIEEVIDNNYDEGKYER